MTPKTTSAALSSISRVVSFILFPQSLPNLCTKETKLTLAPQVGNGAISHLLSWITVPVSRSHAAHRTGTAFTLAQECVGCRKATGYSAEAKPSAILGLINQAVTWRSVPLGQGLKKS